MTIAISRQSFEMLELPDESPNCIGIRAAVDIKIPHGRGFILHHIESPGLRGIETSANPSDLAYLREVWRAECDILADMLTTIGIALND